MRRNGFVAQRVCQRRSDLLQVSHRNFSNVSRARLAQVRVVRAALRQLRNRSRRKNHEERRGAFWSELQNQIARFRFKIEQRHML